MTKIIGGTTSTPMRQSDWNQTDPKKADYIKNKPFDKVDDALSDTSTNPVQNRVITSELRHMQEGIDTLTEIVDELPTNGGGITIDDVKPFRFTVTHDGKKYQSSATYEEIKEVVDTGNRSVICEFDDLELTFAGTNPIGDLTFYTYYLGYRVSVVVAAAEIVRVERDITPVTMINVLDYDAVGDGVTDDTDAIQEALYEAEASGLPLYIPAGNYLVSKTITTHTSDTADGKAKQSKALHIFGAGMGTLFTTTEDFEGDYVFCIEPQGTQPMMLWVRDFAIDLNADVSGICLNNIGMKAIVENLWINHKCETHEVVRSGIYCTTATVATFQRIKVMGVYGVRDNLCCGMAIGGHSVTIVDCDVINCVWGICVKGGSAWVIENCRVDENIYGIYQNGSNNIGEGDKPFADDTATIKSITIKGTRFEGNDKYAIYLVAYGNGYLQNNSITIANNYFTGLGAWTASDGTTGNARAMYFARARGVLIDGNYFNGDDFASTNDRFQNLDLNGVSELVLRGNVASERNKDGVVTKTNNTLSTNVCNYSGFINDIELNQSTAKANCEVRGNKAGGHSKGGTIDVSTSNIYAIGAGVEVTGLNITHGDVNYCQEVTLVADVGDGTATVKTTGVIRLNGGADFVMHKFDTLTLVKLWCDNGTRWVEKCRSVNRAT